MYDLASLNKAIWNIKTTFNRMFLEFAVGRYFCFRTNDDVYFILDSDPEKLSVFIYFALNLSLAEDRVFDKVVEIDARALDEDGLMRSIAAEIIAYTDEFPSRELHKPRYSLFS